MEQENLTSAIINLKQLRPATISDAGNSRREIAADIGSAMKDALAGA